jgi:hypothetical protein
MRQMNPYEAPKAPLFVTEEAKRGSDLLHLLCSFEGRISRAPFIAIQRRQIAGMIRFIQPGGY